MSPKGARQTPAGLAQLDSQRGAFEAGGEVAQDLRSLYDFMRKHLQAAYLTNDGEKMKEVASLLSELNEGWKAISG